MATTLFLFGLLWLFIAIAPFLGPVAGFNRARTREEMRTFWKRSANYAFPVNAVVRAMFCIAYACWMLPMTRPVWGVIGGFAWLLLGGFYRN